MTELWWGRRFRNKKVTRNKTHQRNEKEKEKPEQITDPRTITSTTEIKSKGLIKILVGGDMQTNLAPSGTCCIKIDPPNFQEEDEENEMRLHNELNDTERTGSPCSQTQRTNKKRL